MRMISALSVMGLGVALLGGGRALAGGNSAVLCNPVEANVHDVEYTQWGVHNKSPFRQASVLCGGGKGFNLLSTMSTVVYDRHPVNEVCCTMRLSDPAGNVWWSAVRCTTGFAAAPMTLAAGMPPGGGHVNMQCSLPEAHPANGVSHVTTYDIP